MTQTSAVQFFRAAIFAASATFTLRLPTRQLFTRYIIFAAAQEETAFLKKTDSSIVTDLLPSLLFCTGFFDGRRLTRQIFPLFGKRSKSVRVTRESKSEFEAKRETKLERQILRCIEENEARSESDRGKNVCRRKNFFHSHASSSTLVHFSGRQKNWVVLKGPRSPSVNILCISIL